MGQLSTSMPAADGSPGSDDIDGRDHAANERDRIADERDLAANERERKADQRDHAADERERIADAREDRLTASTAQLNERLRQFRLTADDRVQESRAAIARGHEAVDRSRARLRRSSAALEAGEDRVVREQAEIDRESARTERARDSR